MRIEPLEPRAGKAGERLAQELWRAAAVPRPLDGADPRDGVTRRGVGLGTGDLDGAVPGLIGEA